MTAAPPMVTVMAGNECVGFVLARGVAGFEAFDRDAHPIGLFPTADEAAAAITNTVTKGE
jgi:hypothetical protein